MFSDIYCVYTYSISYPHSKHKISEPLRIERLLWFTLSGYSRLNREVSGETSGHILGYCTYSASHLRTPQGLYSFGAY